jgi:hypothetical protein
MSDVTRFTSPRPSFRAPTNASALEAMAPRLKDTTPAPSVVARAEAAGNVDLAALIAASQTMAKQNAKVIERDKKPRQARAPKGETAEAETPKVAKEPTPKFQPSDVVDDVEFIRRTRSINTHTPEAQSLFWANGGEHHMTAGLTYAQAYDNLRREKIARLHDAKLGKPTTPYRRAVSLPTDTRIVTPGLPTQQDRMRQQAARDRALLTVSNERWAGIRK